MGNCLVTKLKANVQNSSLIGLGEVKIGVSPTVASELYLNPITGESITVKTSDGIAHIKKNAGDSYSNSLDYSHDASYWNNHVICEPGNYSIIITNKYSLEEVYFKDVALNINDLEYSNINKFTVNSYELSGNKLNKNNLEQLSIINCNFNIANIENAPILKTVKFGAGVYGNTSVFSTISTLNMSNIDFSDSSIEGDITHLNSFSGVENIGLIINDSTIHTEKITGDLSAMATTLKGLNVYNKPTEFTWLGTRSNSAFAISMKGCVFGNYVDAMLKNQAQCDLEHPISANDKLIDVYGTHNPEDADAVAAIATIKAAGWTVKINDVAM